MTGSVVDAPFPIRKTTWLSPYEATVTRCWNPMVCTLLKQKFSENRVRA